LAPPDELYERPANAFVAQFIGENNRLTGEVEEVNGSICSIRAGNGAVIKALPVNIDGVGSKTTLSLRPERVVIDPQPNSYPNVFEAEIEELIYLGDHIRTRVSLLGHHDFVIKIPNNQLASKSLQLGTKIQVGWQPEDCRALDA
jgi:putative spermidine/putrescine transport system ATP-binding protein